MSLPGLLLLPVVAVAGALARWLLQARGNLYTDASTRYYVPDPDLGWRVVDSGPVSIGLDAVALLVAYAAALAVGFLLVRRWQRRGGRLPGANRWTGRLVPQILVGLPLLVPAWAFASGAIPSNASEYAPAGLVQAPPDSIAGGLPGLPAGTYRVVPHAGTSIIAHLSGGGEKFDARFARDIQGTWRGAPADLRQPMKASVSVAAAAVDTGIELRTKHAREEYLLAGRFPHITFRLERLLGAERRADGTVAYSAEGTVDLMGLRHRVSVIGTLRAPDPAARSRLGFQPGDPVFLATARFEIKISESKLAPDKGDFDGDIIPLDVSLVLVLRREAEGT
jgi:polyisoprenoid-binding protein YceI